MKKILFLVILALLVFAVMPAAAQDQPYAGVTINLLTFTGPQVAEPLQRRAPDFEKLTGAKVNIVTVPNSALYQTMLTDQATGTNSYQAFVFAPQWIADFATPGYLEDLTSYVGADKDLQWDDVGQFFRNFSATYNGSIYTLPLDGDFHMVYYRTDVLKTLNMEPPKTWDDYVAIAKAAQGTDMNGDGVVRLRLVHFDGEGAAGLLVDHFDCRSFHSNPGNRTGRILRQRHDGSAGQQCRLHPCA